MPPLRTAKNLRAPTHLSSVPPALAPSSVIPPVPLKNHTYVSACQPEKGNEKRENGNQEKANKELKERTPKEKKKKERKLCLQYTTSHYYQLDHQAYRPRCRTYLKSTPFRR